MTPYFQFEERSYHNYRKSDLLWFIIFFLIFNKACLPSCPLIVLEGVFFTMLKGTHFLIATVSFPFTGYHKWFFGDPRILWVQVFLHPYIFALLQNTPLAHSVHCLPFLRERDLLRKCLMHSSFLRNPACLSSCLVRVTWIWSTWAPPQLSGLSKAGEKLEHGAARSAGACIRSVLLFPEFWLHCYPMQWGCSHCLPFHSLPLEH